MFKDIYLDVEIFDWFSGHVHLAILIDIACFIIVLKAQFIQCVYESHRDTINEKHVIDVLGQNTSYRTEQLLLPTAIYKMDTLSYHVDSDRHY